MTDQNDADLTLAEIEKLAKKLGTAAGLAALHDEAERLLNMAKKWLEVRDTLDAVWDMGVSPPKPDKEQ